MEITGYDNDTLTTVAPSRVIPKFLEMLAVKWPEMQLKVVDDRKLTSFHVYRNATSEIFPEEGSILISKDESMEQYWDEMGAKLMKSGEASLLLIYKEKLAGIYAYDLVTPEAVDKDPFSAWAVRALVEAYSGE
jgi:hypothetical protein